MEGCFGCRVAHRAAMHVHKTALARGDDCSTPPSVVTWLCGAPCAFVIKRARRVLCLPLTPWNNLAVFAFSHIQRSVGRHI